ncbi:senescence-specific cysteine protease SAG39 [Trifolium repens]|nr:senescence-specific cysteine protease SAG39 [Trifolium repens]
MQETKVLASEFKEVVVAEYQERFYPQYQATYEDFEEWCKKYDKTYTSEREKRYRFKVFKRCYASVARHNQVGNSSWTEGLNDMSDLTWVEFATTRCDNPSSIMLWRKYYMDCRKKYFGY